MARYQASSRWIMVLRIFDGLYFVWRGIFKLYTPTSVWLVPRVTAALPTTPLASIIRADIFPHVAAFGLTVGIIEMICGSLLLLSWGGRIPPLVLALLNLIFFLTLGFKEPHDMELNLLMGTMNLMFASTMVRKPRHAKTA